jgi:hypothetical protein
MDAIAVTLASCGRYIGVAPLGTSLTDEQAHQLPASEDSQSSPPTPISRAASPLNVTSGYSAATSSIPSTLGFRQAPTQPTYSYSEDGERSPKR